MNPTDSRHTPPQSNEAEMSVLGAIFVDNDAIKTAAEIISADDFYRESHRKIFRCMTDLDAAGSPIDFVTVSTALKSGNSLEEVGGAAYLLTLVDFVPTAANITYYARIVKEKAIARNLLSLSREIQGRIQDGAAVAKVIDETRQKLNTTTDEADAIYGIDAAGDLIDFTERNRQYRQFLRRIEAYRFITGFPRLDKEIRGVAPGEVLIIAAYSGTFKSAMLQHLLLRNARKTGLYSLFFSLEMPATKLFEREASMQSGVNGYTIEHRWRNEPTEAEAIHKACRENGSKKLIVCDRSRLTIEQIGRYIDATRRKYGEIGVAGIDYLGLLAAPGKTLFERIEFLAPELKNLAKAKNIPLVVLSQVNRESVKHNTEIETHSAKGGGGVEAACDFMLGMYQDRDSNLVLKILKNRNGAAGESFAVNIDKPSLRFTGLTSYQAPAARKTGSGIDF